MDNFPPEREPKEEFDIFLSKLHSDRDRAGEEYILLWQKLVIYFQMRACLVADELADETINRVVKKVAGGEIPRNIMAFCYGFARLVYLEHQKKPGTNRGPLVDQPDTHFVGIEELSRKERQTCFDKCLRELPIEEARMLVEYCHHEDRINRDVRKKMAEKQGLSQTALRIRVYRTRLKLQVCMKNCIGEA